MHKLTPFYAKRDRWIVAKQRQGATLIELSARHGISVTRIKQIIKREATKMHKLTPPATDCPKCGCEHAFTRNPQYQELLGGEDGIYGVMTWECNICGFQLNTKPLDDEAPQPLDDEAPQNETGA